MPGMLDLPDQGIAGSAAGTVAPMIVGVQGDLVTDRLLKDRRCGSIPRQAGASAFGGLTEIEVTGKQRGLASLGGAPDGQCRPRSGGAGLELTSPLTDGIDLVEPVSLREGVVIGALAAMFPIPIDEVFSH